MAKPIFCVTHPRACSTAFERVFMTRTNDLNCVHEPFGDAFYFGPERMGSRYEDDETARQESGFANSTFQTILDRIASEETEGKRVFIKDIIHYLFPPNGQTAQIAPSVLPKRRGIGTTNGVSVSNGAVKSSSLPFPYGTYTEPGNPTVLPLEVLKKFHFTFLIRNPHNSIPSYYRCTVPPLNGVTGWDDFYPSEAGYDEVRRIFDFLVASGQVGPKQAGKSASRSNGDANGVSNRVSEASALKNGENDQSNGTNGINGHAVDSAQVNSNSASEICLVDADDLLDDPEGIIKEYCRSVGLEFSPSMLVWDSEEAHQRAKDAFEKWRGFHDDAIESKDLKPRAAHRKKEKTEEEWDAEWKAKYGETGAKLIRETVDANMADYLYLKQFAMKV